MNSTCIRRVVTAFVMLLPAGAAIADNLQHKIDGCAAIDENAARLACYDELVSAGGDDQLSLDDEVEPASAASQPGAADPDEVPDAERRDSDIASPTIIAKEDEIFEVRLTRCSKPSRGERQLFYLDNGEVWQQSNNSRLYVRDCDTVVRIWHDVFGYKMEVTSENRRIRIRPIR